MKYAHPIFHRLLPVSALLLLALLALGRCCGLSAQAGEPEAVTGTVVRVYDGDTVTVRLDALPAWLGREIGVRVAGIDTPELRDTRTAVRALAYEARELTRLYCRPGAPVTLSGITRGKYFRLVATVTCDGTDIAAALLAAGLAKPYDGKGTRSW